MRHKNKIVSVLKSKTASALKDQSGASLVFVLGVMLMLLAAGASVLAAAFGNFGIGIRQENYNRAMLLGDSIHRNIEYSLVERAGHPNSLAQQIARQIYENSDDDSNVIVHIADIELDVAIDGSAIEEVVWSVTLSFPHASAIITPFVPEIPELNIYSRPRRALLNATMLVRVEVEVNSAGALGDRRVITFEAVYEYTGGILTGSPLPPYYYPESIVMSFDDLGEWKMISFEIIDSWLLVKEQSGND